MSNHVLNKLKEIISDFFLFIIFWCLTFGPIVYCIDKVIHGQALEPFRLGNVQIPKLQGAGATYLDVLILYIVGFVAINIGLYSRFKQHKEEKDFKKKYKIKDDKSFADKMIEDAIKDDDF